MARPSSILIAITLAWAATSAHAAALPSPLDGTSRTFSGNGYDWTLTFDNGYVWQSKAGVGKWGIGTLAYLGGPENGPYNWTISDGDLCDSTPRSGSVTGSCGTTEVITVAEPQICFYVLTITTTPRFCKGWIEQPLPPPRPPPDRARGLLRPAQRLLRPARRLLRRARSL